MSEDKNDKCRYVRQGLKDNDKEVNLNFTIQKSKQKT